MLQDFELKQLIDPLQGWFYNNARTLAWRQDPTPYHVWISEIMLQQTRVEAVKPYYERFMQALPDVEALASCSEDVYLKLWEGLGYYSRVRNLHEAANQIMERHGGVIPSDYETLLKLKGIGDYTAGAISSLAYGKPVPAVDGNVLRVIARVTADHTDIMNPRFKKEVRERLLALMEDNRGGDTTLGKVIGCDTGSASKDTGNLIPRIFNQALMELGALVCLPGGAPHCDRCPWRELCQARQQGLTEVLPVRTKAKERRIENRTILILKDADKVAIRKRPAKGLLAGLYELPGLECHASEEEVLAYVKSMGYHALQISSLMSAKHVFSHVEWHMIGYSIRLEEDAFSTEEERERAKKERLIFVDALDVEEHYAIPSAFDAYAKELLKM